MRRPRKMSGQALHRARMRLGLSLTELGEKLRLEAGDPSSRVREMETGARPIGGPTAVAVEAMLAGFDPDSEKAGRAR